MKLCSTCKEEKSFQEFNKSPTTKSGFSSQCKTCKKNYYTKNKAKISERGKIYYKENSEKILARVKNYVKNNPKILSDRLEKYRDEGYFEKYYQKTDVRKRMKDFYNSPDQKAKHASNQKRRELLKSKATPSWLSSEQLKDIDDMYWLSKDLELVSGEKYHVDHIVPVKGKSVSGLHVPWNLQILPSDLNLKKGNKHV